MYIYEKFGHNFILFETYIIQGVIRRLLCISKIIKTFLLQYLPSYSTLYEYTTSTKALLVLYIIADTLCYT